MSTDVTQSLPLDQERQASAYVCDLEAEWLFFRRSVPYWDEVARKWPEGRFQSFISNEKSA